jgi:hypothetical protein
VNSGTPYFSYIKTIKKFIFKFMVFKIKIESLIKNYNFKNERLETLRLILKLTPWFCPKNLNDFFTILAIT